MLAAGEVLPQSRIGFQSGPQEKVVIQYEPAHWILTVPIPKEFKMLRDFYYKKLRFSLRILNCSLIASSYHITLI